MGKKGIPRFDVFDVAVGSNKTLEAIAWLGLGGFWLVEMAAFVSSAVESYSNSEGGLTAMGLIMVANDFGSVVITGGLLFGWHAICHASSYMRSHMQSKLGGMTPSGIMGGGFLPIPAMLSMSILMFVTSTFCSESYVRGEWLLPASGSMEVWVPDLRCRWTAIEDNTWLTEWFGRYQRVSAIRQFGGRDPKAKGSCYMGEQSKYKGTWLYETGKPKDFPASAIINATGGAPLKSPTSSTQMASLTGTACTNARVGSHFRYLPLLQTLARLVWGLRQS